MINWIELIFTLCTGVFFASMALRKHSGAAMYGRAKQLVIGGFIAHTLLRMAHMDTWRTLPVAAVMYGFVFFFIASTGLPPGKGFEAEQSVWSEPKSRRVIRRSFGFAGMAAALVCLAALALFPLPAIAAPNGPHRVGTQSFQLSDPVRIEQYAPSPGVAVPRNIMVQAWYPLAPDARGQSAFWLPDAGVRNALARMSRLPQFAMSHLARARLPAVAGAEPAAGKWPVVILSHGWTGTRYLHADLALELASRGIMVLAIDHPYGAMSTTMADGTVIDFSPAALPGKAGDPGFWDNARKLVGTYSDDQLMLIDAVRNDRLVPAVANACDAQAIAIAGHSTGGGAAVLSAYSDPSIRAVLALDAWVKPLGNEVDTPADIPQLHLGSAAWNDDENEPFINRVLAGSTQATALRLAGTRHEDYAMTLQITPASRMLGMSGGIEQNNLRQALRTAADWLASILYMDEGKAADALGRTQKLSAYMEH